MSDPKTDAGHCYRHPDRESYILCQRCGRTICPECQTPAPVGFQCPECMREARASAPRTRPAVVTRMRGAARGGGPIVTYSIIAVTAVIWVLQILPVVGGAVTNALAYAPVLTVEQPWRMLTAALVHSDRSVVHLLFNMFTLFIFGRILEPTIGRARFGALYAISALGGSAAVLLLDPLGAVVGASGAVFGLMGATLVIQRGLGGNATGLLILIGLNLVSGFFIPNVSWQGHLGGVIAGALVGLVYIRTRGPRRRTAQVLLTIGVALLIVVATVIGVVAYFG